MYASITMIHSIIKMKASQFERRANSTVLGDWCITIFDFLLLLDPLCAVWINPFKEMLINAIDKDKKKIIKGVYKETKVIIRELRLPYDILMQLNSILLEKFDYNLIEELKLENNQVNNIIKRGRIRNDSEYELVKQREEDIYADNSQRELMLKLQQLMLAYEFPESKKKKGSE